MYRPYRDRSVANMPRDLRPGPDSPPADELQGAEDTLAVLQHVLHTIAAEDMSRQTPCVDFDVTRLTEHLLKSIAGIGGIAPGRPWMRGTIAVWTATCHSATARCPPRRRAASSR